MNVLPLDDSKEFALKMVSFCRGLETKNHENLKNLQPDNRKETKMITQNELKRLLHYDSETGEFTWKVRSSNRVRVGDSAGYKRPDDYIHISIGGKDYLAHRLAWMYIYGYFPENDIDHIDRDPSNNRIENLREISRQCNIRNTGNNKNNKSGVKGVGWHKARKKWCAQIMVNGKNKYLGLYENFADAVKARYNAEKELNWSGCDSSSPAYQWLTEK